MSHLIFGGTGTVGGALVRELLRRGEKGVRVVTRSRERAAALPQGVESVIGDLANPDTYEPIFDGAERVFIVNVVSPAELQEGLAAVNESRRVGAKRIVYLSVQNADGPPHVPHFAAKALIEKAIAATGIPFTVLRPSNFYQNDAWLRDAILQFGVYPQPLGDVGVSRVDVGDIALAAANALTKPGHEGKTYELVGPEPLTGRQVAEAYSEALGREIRYGGNDVEAWGQQMRQVMPNYMVYDFKLMFTFFQTVGLRATKADVEGTTKVVGRPPRPFADYVRELVGAWQAQPTAGVGS